VIALVSRPRGRSVSLLIPRVAESKLAPIRTVVLAALGALVAACGNDGPPGPSMSTESPHSITLDTATATPTMVPSSPTPVPHVTVEVIWFNANAETRTMRFLAVIHNSSSQTIEGLQTSWEVFDARGSRLESSGPSKSAALPPGDSYTGGAILNLSPPIPASVVMTITDPGQLTSGQPSDLPVSEVKFEPSTGKNEYVVTALVTTGTASVEHSQVYLTVVGFDADGRVVGVNWGFPSRPGTLSPNTRLRLSSSLPTPDGVPVKVEVYARVNLEPARTEINIVGR
jgi:hypothetical protein